MSSLPPQRSSPRSRTCGQRLAALAGDALRRQDERHPAAGQRVFITWCDGFFPRPCPLDGHLAVRAASPTAAIERIEAAGWVRHREFGSAKAICPDCWLAGLERVNTRDDEVDDSDLGWATPCSI